MVFSAPYRSPYPKKNEKVVTFSGYQAARISYILNWPFGPYDHFLTCDAADVALLKRRGSVAANPETSSIWKWALVRLKTETSLLPSFIVADVPPTGTEIPILLHWPLTTQLSRDNSYQLNMPSKGKIKKCRRHKSRMEYVAQMRSFCIF